MGKKSEKYPYGKCHICQNEIAIPGIDKYKCSGCGWRDYPKKPWVWNTTKYK